MAGGQRWQEAYRRVVLEQRMVEFEAFHFAARKEAVLANVEVEVLERAVSEADDRVLLADRALGVVSGRLGRGQPMQDRHPDYGLRLELEPFEEVGQAHFRSALGLSESAANTNSCFQTRSLKSVCSTYVFEAASD